MVRGAGCKGFLVLDASKMAAYDKPSLKDQAASYNTVNVIPKQHNRGRGFNSEKGVSGGVGCAGRGGSSSFLPSSFR